MLLLYGNIIFFLIRSFFLSISLFLFLKSFSFLVRFLLYKFKDKRNCTLFIFLFLSCFFLFYIRAGNTAFLTCLLLSHLLFSSFYFSSMQSRIFFSFLIYSFSFFACFFVILDCICCASLSHCALICIAIGCYLSWNILLTYSVE